MAVMLDHPLKPNEYGTGVVGSCNGLLCLSNMDMEQMVLWNFSTRKHHKLPVAPIIENSGFLPAIVYGFAYDSVRDDYKLVRIVQYYNGKNDGSVYSEVRVYTLKSNSWRRIQDFPYYLPYNTYKQLKQEIVVLVSGALHWVVCGGPNLGKANLIAAFDVGVEEFRLVPQPDYLDDKDFGMSVGSLGGCLCINCNYATDRVDVWVMKEYGVKESWTKLFSVEQPSVIFQFFDVRPLAYSKTGGEVLLDQDNAKLFWFDLRTKTVKNVKILCWPSFDEDLICVGSLVPLHSNGG